MVTFIQREASASIACNIQADSVLGFVNKNPCALALRQDQMRCDKFYFRLKVHIVPLLML